MNSSDWRKAAVLVTQHKHEATMADTDQLSSMPHSQIAIDDSGLPLVHYGSHMPVAASTPTGTIAHLHSSQQEDSYQEIIPGIPQGSLYPTLSSLSSGFVASDTNAQSLSNKVTKGLDQYLQDAEQLRASEANYFDDTVRPTNTSPMPETEEQVNHTSQNNLTTAKQESIDETELAINILVSLKTDTGHPLQWQTVHHSKASTEMQTINMINYQMRMTKILSYTTKMYFMTIMILQLLTLLLMAPQLGQKSQSQNFSLSMMLPYQVKRLVAHLLLDIYSNFWRDIYHPHINKLS